MFIEESRLFINGSPFIGERRSVSLLRRRIWGKSRRDEMFIEESSLIIHRSPFMGERVLEVIGLESIVGRRNESE